MAGEAEQAVNLVVLFSASGIADPVVAAKKRSVVLAATQTAKNIQISKPSREEVGHFVIPLYRICTTASFDHLTGNAEVLLPW